MKILGIAWEYKTALVKSKDRIKHNYIPRDHSCDTCTFKCIDCNVCTFKINEYYGLNHWLWKLINPSVKGMLCIRCVENRLGRELTRADFPYGNMNDDNHSLCHSSHLLLNRRGQIKLLR